MQEGKPKKPKTQKNNLLTIQDEIHDETSNDYSKDED
jgi:hypothetical protein